MPVLGADAVASHRSAAALWGIDGPFAGHVELTGHLGSKARPKGAIVHESTDLAPEHVTVRRGVPVTNPLRTLVDLGAVVGPRVLDRSVDDVLARRLATYEGLLDLLGSVARRGRRGAGRLRASLAARTGAPESVLEAELERLLLRSDLPEPERQYVLRANGVFVARVDFAYPDLRLAIEADGSSTRADRAALDYDDERQNRIVARDWLPLRYTWRQVVGAPIRTLADINRQIQRRANHLGLRLAS